MLDQMRRQTEDIVRYYGELNRRIANAGMDGIPKLLELSTQLEMALLGEPVQFEPGVVAHPDFSITSCEKPV